MAWVKGHNSMSSQSRSIILDNILALRARILYSIIFARFRACICYTLNNFRTSTIHAFYAHGALKNCHTQTRTAQIID